MRVRVAANGEGLTSEDVVRRIAAECAFVDERGGVGILPSGHDAWVVGDEPVVVVDWFGASNYARSP
jgi:hypothetical protein